MEILNSYLSGLIMPVLLIILGIFFALKLKFFYILHPLKTVQSVLNNRKNGFKALSVALAGTLGVGNIVGVASAILLGGAGSIFWMWVSAICAMSLKYAEVYLAMKFRKEQNGQFYGGAPYYIKEGLRKKIGLKSAYFLSLIFAVFCVINSLTTGSLVQINSVSSLLPISPLCFGIAFTVLAFFAISGGIKRIGTVTSWLIPALTASYVFICLTIILSNFADVPKAISLIIKDAFNLKSAVGGFCGFGFSRALRYGVSRGVLSNEAGCGTSPAAHASSESDNPHGQGCLGIFEVFVDTILLCTLTAIVILISVQNTVSSPMDLVIRSFEQFAGKLGGIAVTALSVCFAFATVICQYFYGIEALSYVSKARAVKTFFTFIFCLVLLVGAVIPMSLMWQISDLAIAVMTIVNLICLFVLREYF